MGSLRSQGCLCSARDVLQPLVRDLGKKKGQGVCWGRRVVGGSDGWCQVSRGVGSWALSGEKDGGSNVYLSEGPCQPSVPPSLSFKS